MIFNIYLFYSIKTFKVILMLLNFISNYSAVIILNHINIFNSSSLYGRKLQFI